MRASEVVEVDGAFVGVASLNGDAMCFIPVDVRLDDLDSRTFLSIEDLLRVVRGSLRVGQRQTRQPNEAEGGDSMNGIISIQTGGYERRVSGTDTHTPLQLGPPIGASCLSQGASKSNPVAHCTDRRLGTHLLIDLWGAVNTSDAELIDTALRKAAQAAGATILHGHFHQFATNSGVSGVLLLAESHITIHTWPERAFAAVDVFMCGACDPHDAVPVLQATFRPERIQLDTIRRGRL